MKTKEFLFALLFITVLLLLYVFFPVKDIFQRVLTMIVFLGIIPIIFNKLILKRSLDELGLRVGDWRQGVIWSAISVVIIGLILFITSYFFGFLKHYTVPGIISGDYKTFILYELSVFLFVVVIYEMFFRGFIMFILETRMPYWRAIVIQAVIFLFFVLAVDFHQWTLIPYIIFAPFAGVVAEKSRSIIYSSVLQIIILIILDASVIKFNL